jgi:hypothetical protein
MNLSAESVAMAWIEKWRSPPAEHNPQPDDLDLDLPRTDPRLCLDAIIEVLARIPNDPSDHHFQALAAGPLEDLIAFHGKAFLGELELHARRSPPFRLLLNGVWFDKSSEQVREHLSKYLSGRW